MAFAGIHPRIEATRRFVDELIPESHLRGNEQIASVSVLGASG
jgi:hypothetical protein